MAKGNRTRRSPREVVISVLVVVLFIGGGIGYSLLNRPGGELEGRILWQEDVGHPDLGPEGWLRFTRDTGGFLGFGGDTEQVLRNVRTGEEHTFGLLSSVDHILTGGRYLSLYLDVAYINEPTSEKVAEIEVASIGEGVKGLSGLVPGSDMELVGSSEDTAAMVTCYAPDEADLDSVIPEGRVVVAGFDLSEGSRTWAHDTGAACDKHEVYYRPEQTLGAIEHVVLYDGDTATVLRLDDGSVRATWQDTPKDSVVLRGDLALHRSGEKVTVTDLSDRSEVASTRCAGASPMAPGTTANLTPEAALAVECEDEVRVLDPEAGEFVALDGAPLGKNNRVPEGETVVYDRYLLHRSGSSVTITDGLTDARVGEVTVPPAMQVTANYPRGRVLQFFEAEYDDDNDVSHEKRSVDLHTGNLLISDSDKVSPGGEVDPRLGLILVTSWEQYTSYSRYGGSTEHEVSRAWLTGPDGEVED